MKKLLIYIAACLIATACTNNEGSETTTEEPITKTPVEDTAAPEEEPAEEPAAEEEEIPEPKADKPSVSEAPINQLIQVESPAENAVVTSPLTVTGRARGYWYFEAEFPVYVKSADDVILGWAPGRAQGEWMTEDWVPFEAIIEFTKPDTETGYIELKRSNASGKPEHDRSMTVPVRFE